MYSNTRKSIEFEPRSLEVVLHPLISKVFFSARVLSLDTTFSPLSLGSLVCFAEVCTMQLSVCELSLSGPAQWEDGRKLSQEESEARGNGSSDDSGSTQEEERNGEGRFNSFTLNTVYLIEQTAIHEDAIKH